MGDRNISEKTQVGVFRRDPVLSCPQLDPMMHPAWRAFCKFCNELQHGEIECLKIQNGLPVLAEVITKKIKF